MKGVVILLCPSLQVWNSLAQSTFSIYTGVKDSCGGSSCPSVLQLDSLFNFHLYFPKASLDFCFLFYP